MTVESDREMDHQKVRNLDSSAEMDASDIVAGYTSAFWLMRTAKMTP